MDNKISELLKNRKKKPKFVVQDKHKKKRLKDRWRKSRGSDSKMGQKKRGYRVSVSVGYGAPKAIYGLNKNGLKGVLIHSIKEIDGIKKGRESIIIAKGIGLKKKISIIKKAREGSIEITNIKNADDYIKKFEEKIEERKNRQKKKKIEKKKKEVANKENLSKKIEAVEKKEDDEKGKKDEKKKEIDKMLIKKGLK